jgi:hypothetical protein
MPNLFSTINLNIPASADSSIDFKLLDSTCNHQILNEQLIFNPNILFAGVVYSGITNYGNLSTYSDFDPNTSVTVTTSLPLGTSYYQLFEVPTSSPNNPIIDEFIVPSGLTQKFQLSFPPEPQSLSAELKIINTDQFGDLQTTFFPFTNYSVAQLFGVVQFNNVADIGSTVDFSYVGSPKQIFMNTSTMLPNWQFLGYNQNGQGVFRIYARAFQSNKSQLFIRYITISSSCPRCGGLNIINDLDFNQNTNRFYNVYDFSKMIQDFFKRFLTAQGSNPFDSTDGTQIPIYIGLGKNNPALIDTLLRTQVINLVDTLRLKQNTQAVVQGISLAEQIQQISQLSIVQINPTDVTMTINVTSLSQATAQLSTNIQGN